ncbi:MAG TPA: DNA-3-methyladenine glycosylase [Bacillota bacterium]
MTPTPPAQAGRPENPPLPEDFFRRTSLVLAQALLGAELVHRTPDGEAAGIIVEVEAYCGPVDRAAHSYGGRRTARTEVMYEPGGCAYVYQIYGMHFCFNVVAAGRDEPQAVLVRALEPRHGLELMAQRRGITLTDADRDWIRAREGAPPWKAAPTRPSASLRALTAGPARLCQALAIRRHQNGLPLTRGPLVIRRGFGPPPPEAVAVGPRINVDYAGVWAKEPLRFWIDGNPFVSR